MSSSITKKQCLDFGKIGWMKLLCYCLIMLTIWILYVLLLLTIMMQFSSQSYWDQFFHALPGSFRNEDTNRNIYELIESRGFKAESHYIKTDDGYILQMVRIRNPFVDDHVKLRPILMHHGFQCTGTLWLVARNGSLGPDGQYKEYYYEEELNDYDDDGQIDNYQIGDSLAFVLSATRSYDVWLANYRGSIYSTNHTNQSFIETSEFWKFSIDEMIMYDIPAEIDYILNYTKSKTIGYIGHSQGNLMMFSLMSISDHYSRLIKPFIAISPVFYNSNIKGQILTFTSMIDYLRSNPSLVPYSNNVQSFFSTMCENILTRRLCYYAFYRFTGTELKNVNWRRLTVYIANVPMGSSSWNAAHLLQLYSRNDGRLVGFDLGDHLLNLDRYSSPFPHEYKASKINCSDIALIYSVNDWLNPLENVERLKKDLQGKLIDDYQVPDDSYGHLDLIWANNVGQMVNWKVLDILYRYKSLQ